MPNTGKRGWIVLLAIALMAGIVSLASWFTPVTHAEVAAPEVVAEFPAECNTPDMDVIDGWDVHVKGDASLQTLANGVGPNEEGAKILISAGVTATFKICLDPAAYTVGTFWSHTDGANGKIDVPAGKLVQVDFLPTYGTAGPIDAIYGLSGYVKPEPTATATPTATAMAIATATATDMPTATETPTPIVPPIAVGMEVGDWVSEESVFLALNITLTNTGEGFSNETLVFTGTSGIGQNQSFISSQEFPISMEPGQVKTGTISVPPTQGSDTVCVTAGFRGVQYGPYCGPIPAKPEPTATATATSTATNTPTVTPTATNTPVIMTGVSLVADKTNVTVGETVRITVTGIPSTIVLTDKMVEWEFEGNTGGAFGCRSTNCAYDPGVTEVFWFDPGTYGVAVTVTHTSGVFTASMEITVVEEATATPTATATATATNSPTATPTATATTVANPTPTPEPLGFSLAHGAIVPGEDIVFSITVTNTRKNPIVGNAVLGLRVDVTFPVTKAVNLSIPINRVQQFVITTAAPKVAGQHTACAGIMVDGEDETIAFGCVVFDTIGMIYMPLVGKNFYSGPLVTVTQAQVDTCPSDLTQIASWTDGWFGDQAAHDAAQASGVLGEMSLTGMHVIQLCLDNAKVMPRGADLYTVIGDTVQDEVTALYPRNLITITFRGDVTGARFGNRATQ